MEKHSVSRLSYLFAHLYLLSSYSFSSNLSLLYASSLLCFSSLHIVGSLTSKLPSITCVLHHHGTEHFSRERLRRVLRKKAHICRSTSSHLHICRSTSSHLHICRSASSHLHICRSSLSLPFFLPLFFLSLSKAGAVPPERHKTQPFRAKWKVFVCKSVCV